ncbi:asp (abnormal spindle) homolog, microcephaly associated (Drosophila) [Seminavis robusta]|uniref:Asp (Abnormal spindle) homolog, microcephaly associated (Drosophila) n=1 Tax=Seminavis robusta TaxID=568900 RepID=A0A9N8DCS2_9STRA|nr:asp (abnormal spindle) homolog, microcephaly associated (Drosophila) [Seminavis robusta]|eukprot:Sro37_g023210.1 asp (abnormal spindle) homolog, microcephaly associated (Drosophila) (1466) ;mRNA; r:65299-69786
MYSSKKAYSKVVLAVVTIQKNWRAYSGRKRKIFTRAIIHEEGIEVEQVQQLTWLKRLRTISAVLVQTWYRANKERRKYLSLQRKRAEQRAEQQPAVPVGSKSPIQDPSIGANSVDTVRVDEATHITLLSPLWLFRPEVVLSMPVSIASCLDSSRAAKATGTMDMSTSFHGAKQEETVADEIRPSTNNTKEDRPAATTLAMMSNPVTRAEVLHQLRLIVSSVCRLQAWSRGRLERLFEIRMEMASILAAVFRGVRVRRFVLRIRSAMLIQSQFRAQVCSLEFQRMRKGFSSLQLKWAIYSSRPEFIARIEKRNKGLSAFQRVVKEQYRIKSTAVFKIQRQWKLRRGFIKLQKVAKRRYNTKTRAAVRLQQFWRMTSAKSAYLRLKSAILLQKFWRMASAKLSYSRLKAAILLQKFWRMASAKLSYSRLKAAILLQKFWRMTSAQSSYSRLRSAIRLQKFWRMTLAQSSYSRLRSAIRLQKFWRMTLAQSSYSRLRSAIRLQKFWRMTSAQSSYLLLRSMAVRLQSRWRCFSMRSSFCVQLDGFCCLQQLARKSHETKTLAVVVLQTQARMKIMVDKYLRKQLASSLLQKACRGHLACSRYRKMYNGFRHVQQRAQQRFLDKTVASVLIQRFWRMETQRAKFDKLFIGVISLQKLAIEAFARKSDAATDIQARWRCHTNYCILQEKKEASITIQQYQRRHSSRTKTQKMKNGFLTLRVLGQDRFQKKTKAVIRLQRFWRMLSCSMEYFAIIGATIALQSRWRSHSCRTKWITFCHGFTRLQLLAHRAYIRKTAAATLIQRVWRRYSALVAYETSLLSVILVQSHWRRHKCEGRFAVQLRGFSNLRDLGKAQFSLKTVSATAIQAQWRKSFAKHNFSIVRAAAISIQAQIRGKMQRAAYSMMIPGFVSLQVLAKLWFRIKNTCAVKIQTAARRMAAQKRFQFQQGASVTIQCVFRGFVQRRNLAVLRWLHSIAATMLASWWRRIACESRYQRLRYATLALQFRVRRRRRERASIKIESWWRCLRQRQAYLREISAITLQALWRSWRQRRVYTRILGAISIQAWWRCLSQRRAYLRDMAAIKLQSWYRFFVQRQLYLLQKRSAMKIETTARLYLTFCRERHAAARKIQESWLDAKKRFILRCLIAVRRRANAAKLIQRRYREVLLSRRQEELLREVEAETKRALDETMSVFSNEYLLSRSASTMSWQSQYPNKAQSCTASSMFCNFDFSMAALAMPWGGLTKNASGRSVCGDDSSSRRRKDPKKPATIREEARRMRSAILIQREWRMFQSKRKKELYYKNISSAWIQCIWRGYAARKRAEKIRRDAAATRIQKAWLRAQIRKLEFLQCVRLQSFCRMVHWKTQFAIIRASSHDAAASIQGLWRMYSARVSFKRLVSVALTLQRVTRENIRKEKAARKIQNVWWIYRIRREVFDQKKNSTSSLPAMVLQAGLAWVLSDPRVIEFALNGGI